MNFIKNLLNKFPNTSTGLPILMYHKLSLTRSDPITVKWDDFRRQMDFLRSHQVAFLSLVELEKIIENKVLPSHPQVLLTFDDGDEKTLDLLYPYLKEQHIKATSFLPVFYMGKDNAWDGGGEKVISLEKAKELAAPFLTWALHSYQHQSYDLLSKEMIKKDLVECFVHLESLHIPFYKALAYPYGAFPRDKSRFQQMAEIFQELGIKLAFRIGNRKNPRPWESPYLLQRLDIQGQRSFEYFKKQLNLK